MSPSDGPSTAVSEEQVSSRFWAPARRADRRSDYGIATIVKLGRWAPLLSAAHALSDVSFLS